MWTPEKETQYQQLGSQLGFLQAPIQSTPEQTGFLGFTGQSVANIIPSAIEKIAQPMQFIMGGGGQVDPVQIPRFFDTKAPQGVGEHVVAGASELASYLPAIAMSEGLGVAGLQGLGVGARLAKLGGSALGFGLPMTPQGGETAAVQGGVGALQTAAQDFGWRGKITAGLLGGAAGYYEGAKGPEGTPTQGAIYGALNLLGPTLIDPAIAHITGANKAAAVIAKDPTALPAVQPHAPTGPIPFAVSPDGPKDISLFKLQTQPLPTETGGMPFYEVPPPLDIGGGRPIIGQTGGLRPPTVEGLNANLQPVQKLETGLLGTGSEFAYGRQLDVPDVFAGVQRPPILSQGETFPLGPSPAPAGFRRTLEGDIFPVKSAVPQLRMSSAEAAGNYDPSIYGRNTDLFDIFAGLQQRPSTVVLSPEETAARIKFEASKPASAFPPPAPITKGKQPKLQDTVPAIKVGNTILKGKAGETHQDILNRHLETNPDDVDALIDFDTKKNPNFFVTTGGRELSREQLQEHFGVRDSQGLRDLQGKGEPAPEPPPKKEPVRPAAVSPQASAKVRIKGRFGLEEAKIIGSEGNTLHVEIDDPIFGKRQTSVLKQDTLPAEVATVQLPEGVSTAPFKETPSLALTGREGVRGVLRTGEEGDMLGTPDENAALELQQAIREAPEVVGRNYDPHAWKTVDDAIRRAKFELDLWKERFSGEDANIHSQAEANKVQKWIDKWQDQIRSSIVEGAGPTPYQKNVLALKGHLALTIEEGIKKLPLEAGTLIKEILGRIETASGQTIDTSLALRMPGTKGSAYQGSGRVALNLQWINQVVGKWDKLSPANRDKALLRIATLFAHEVTHVAHRFGEKSSLAIGGEALTTAIVRHVDGLNKPQREYIIGQIQKMKGDPSPVVSKYLSGDIDAVYGYYKRFKSDLTREGAKELAAGEVMAEIGAVELIKRMKVEGLPQSFREAVDKFKQVIIRALDWFRELNDDSGVAGLQGLSDIVNKMFDHFGAADTAELGRAFPSSEIWKAAAEPLNPFLSVKTAPPIGSSLVSQPFAVKELARIGVRAAVGAGLGAAAGPTLSEHHMTFAESIIAGGIMGAFGPIMLKAIINTQATKELIDAAKKAKGGSFAGLQTLLQNDKLRNLGAQARYGWRGDGSFAAKVVRTLESEMKVNFDPKLKAVYEQARGIMGYQLAMIQRALDESRWVSPSAGVKMATEQYIEGKIPTEAYRALLQDDGAKLYGELMIAAREGTTIGSENIAAGMRQSALRTAIIDSSEKYVGRFYRAYREGKFDMSYFDKVKADIMTMNPGLDIHNADALLREHMVEIKANRELFSGKRGTGAQAIDSKIQLRRRATEEEIYMQQQEVAHLEHNPYSPEYKAAKQKLDWMESHKITDNWRGWLGEIKDPTERMLYTFQKIYPSSISGKVFDLLDNSLDSFGNKWAYSSKELSNTRSALEGEIATATGKPEVTALQIRLKELEAFTPLPEGASYGKLSGKFTNRFVRDEISTYDTPYKWMDQPVLRAISQMNQMVKINRTVLNPATALRNYMQMPLFMLMARVSPQEIWQAAQVIHKGTNPELLKLMYERHILGVDYAAQELTANLGHMVSGYMDADIASKTARAGYAFMHKAYQQPDMLLRAGAFISAQKRIAERMSLPLEHPSVIDAAVEAADRVTMNYATVPRIVKAARQLPFVSLFISYTSEITKIIKNLSMDAISKDTHIQDRMHAIAVLGGMAAIPALLTAGFEGNLSPQDRKDWDKLRTLQPDYARSRFYLPLSRDPDGRFRYMDMTSMIPADNYTQMMKSALSGDVAAARAANPIFSLQDTPLLNIATEQISGTDLRTGHKVAGLQRASEVLKEILPPIVPPGFEGERLLNAFSQNATGTLGLTNLKTGVQTRPSDIIASYLTGMRFANVQLSTVQKSAASEAQQAIVEEKQHLNETIRMNVPDEDKRQAMNRYSESVKQIMLQLQTKLTTL